MKKRGYSWIVVVALLVGTCQGFFVPQVANAGSLNFGTDAGGAPAGGTVSIANNEKFDLGDGAFNIEMWVRESSRVGYANGVRSGQDQQYQALFFGGSNGFNWNEGATKKNSWGIGVTFDPGVFYIATQAGQTTPAYAAGRNNDYPVHDDYPDTASSNTKTNLEVFNTFANLDWHHIAFSKTGVGGALSGYLDGVRVLYVPIDNNIFNMYGGNVVIGGGKFVGQMSDVRLVKGQALYTGPSISVPTSKITTTSQGADASKVSLLLKTSVSGCTIEDFSNNHFPVLINGATCSNAVSRVIDSYNIQFDNQGHGTKPTEIGNIKSIAVGSLPTISNDGSYVLQGWSTTPTGSVLSGTYTATVDTTLYAIWASPPGAPTVASVTGITPTSATVAITAPASNGGAAIDKYIVTSDPATSNVELVQSTSGTVTFTGLTAATSYSFTAIAHNAVGNSSTSTAVSFTTAAKIAPTISSFTVPALTVNSASSLTAVSNVAGTFAFKVGGSDISSCGTKSTTGSGSTFSATCSYTPADGSSKTFTLNFTPTNTGDYSSLTAQNSTQATPGKLNLTVSAFTIPALAVNTSATLSATASVAGAFTFKENGTAISGCTSQSTSGSSPFTATCSYTPASGTLKTFTLSFVPTATTVYNSLSDVSSTTSTPSKINTELTGFANLQKSASDAPFQLTAPVVTGSIPGTFTYAVSNSAIATITDTSTVTMVGAGTVVITATFTPTDSGSYNTSTKSLTLVVSSLANTITFASLNAVTVLTAPFNLTATATGGTVTYSTATSSSICTLNNGLVTPVGPGTCTIVASNNGNAVYGAASSVTRSLTINAVAPGAPTITSLSVGGTSATDNESGYATIRYSGTVENGASITSFTLIATPDSGAVVTAVVNLAAGTRTSTLSGLTLGVRYTFTVKATNSIGSSADSNAISKTPTANPEAPTNLIVTPGNATLTATWTAPNLGGATFVAYDVYLKRSADASFPGTANFSIIDINTTTKEFTSLTNGVAYDVKVAALTLANGAATSVNTAAVYLIPATTPSAPRITLSHSDTSTATVRWNSNGDGGSALTGYTIAVTAGGIAKTCTFTFTPGTTDYSCAITGLAGGSIVSATAIATNLIGNSATTTAVPLKFIGAILAPTTAVVTNGSTQAVVAFTINENGDQIVSFEYSFDGISFLPLAGTTSPLTFTGLTNGTSYSLYIRGKGAVNGIGATSAAFVLAPTAPAPIVVVTPVAPVPVVVAGPLPSTLKAIITPKISRDDNGYYCEIGKYVFLREGYVQEMPKLTSRVFSLLLNGNIIDTLKTTVDKVSFAKRDSYLDTTLTCQVEVGQENLTTTSYSLNSVADAAYSLTKKDAIEAADAKYYKDRQAAYAKKNLEFARLLSIKNASIAASKSSKDILEASVSYQKAYSAASKQWKTDLADASTSRLLAKELAQKRYTDALEMAGISIYPVTTKNVVTPTVTPTIKPTPSPTPTPTNVQPTATMKKVGTFYMTSGSYFLNDAAKLSLKALAWKINATEVKQVLVYGHTDSRGGVNNTWLSQQRAKAVANYLRPLLRSKKLVIGWYASRKPIATGTSKADLAKNRRVEIYVK
jgi:outer membrane protein OmpA-like peptidoglycan-associated protein